MDEAVRIAVASYENVDAVCPTCHRLCRFNRVSDLRDLEPIGGKDVTCLYPECGATFRIVGDTVNARFEMLIWECYSLLEEKRYTTCALNLAQAYECFFSLFLRVVLCYEPQRGRLHLSALNESLKQLGEVTKTWTYPQLSRAFAALVAEHGARLPSGTAPQALDSLTRLSKQPIGRSVAVASDPWKGLLLRLQSNPAPDLRNRVVHKAAYRPSRDEVAQVLAETRLLLFAIAHEASIMGEDPNWYLRAV